MKRLFSLRLFSLAIMVYMLVAFLWWAYLLAQKNQLLLNTQIELLRVQYDSAGTNEMVALENTDAYKAVVAENRRQHKMILGEGAVFSCTLLLGLWLIHRSYRREMSAARQQSNFLLSITHELKSPIASIRLVLETLLKRELNPEQSKRLSTNALKETNRLNELVNDLLFSAKLEKAYKPDIERLDLSLLFNRILQDVKSIHPEVEFSFSIEDNLPEINGDRQALTSVFSNLIENGIKYNFSNEKKIGLKVQSLDKRIEIDLADNGSGIPLEEQKKIFKKFYRVGNEDTRKAKGTGLGLYIVKEIVKAHKGQIQVGRNHPKGSIFKIILPLNH
ncbi:MAG: ATP-binding protein [Saprospiraceae bacterium]